MKVKRSFGKLKGKVRYYNKLFYLFIYNSVPLLYNKYNAIKVVYYTKKMTAINYLKKFLLIEDLEIEKLLKKGLILLDYHHTDSKNLIMRNSLFLIPKYIPIKQNKADVVDFEILKETKQYLIINKKAGIKTYSCFPDMEKSVISSLLSLGLIKKQKYIDYESNIVHRLDIDTTGPLIVAKDDKYSNKLKPLFKYRKINKCYIALVYGKFINRDGIIEFPVTRNCYGSYGNYMITARGNNKWARTIYNVLDNRHGLSLVKLNIITGRTHQIRIHMKTLGHPICGDKFYALKNDKRFPRQMLHSYLLEFTDPFNNEKVKIFTTIPEDMRRILREVYYV